VPKAWPREADYGDPQLASYGIYPDIGLAAVERIIRRHGGRIRAGARPGEGAIFRFTLGEAE
jgi:K+-sensing histidine kinase KdpD